MDIMLYSSYVFKLNALDFLTIHSIIVAGA
jgi:hypothetical protein